MEIIDQHTKKIMEECKVRARDEGLRFDDESLEYMVSNQDMIELSPKGMIPTLYDYWVNDVEVLKGKGQYKLYPHNPYETVINSRPAISYYNDNNPDWLNIMIFYHVIGHIDFFQNNIFFKHTWGDDFVGQALADKRLMEQLRSEHGRWVDYVIEFARSVDNLVGYYNQVNKVNYSGNLDTNKKVKFYFQNFLQEIVKVKESVLYSEISRYNKLLKENEIVADSIFFSEVKSKYPEFEAKYERYLKKPEAPQRDIMEYIIDESPFINKEENEWMKYVLNIVRNTSIYFAPQIRTKIANEGWASYWHDYLFRKDERIKGHEVDYAKINAMVTSISRVGLNPYAIGLRLMQYIEELADKGKISHKFQLVSDSEEIKVWNKNTGKGKDAIFEIRKNFTDFMLLNTFIDQGFVAKHDLFVVGKRPNPQRGTIEYYVKSRKAEDYKKTLIDTLYHPPIITIDENQTNDDQIHLNHIFEGRQLYKPYIADTLIGISYLWGGLSDKVEARLNTTEILKKKSATKNTKAEYENRPVLYRAKNRKVSKTNLK